MNKYDKGVVDWYDTLKGEGMVRNTTTGEIVYFHHSALPNRGSDYKKTLKRGDAVKFKVWRDLTYTQVSKLKKVS